MRYTLIDTEFSANSSPGQQLPRQSVPIVAIGASAGGLEAISELLQYLSPTTDLAYVYIQHLSPTHPSHLSDILGRKTTMPVLEARHRMPIDANHVYIIPPDKDMEVIDGVLLLVPRQPKPAIHLPIDQFFISLAERQQDASIAIILSGTAHDGTLGLKAIKVVGGITLVQDETAKFQGMPQSALAEGVVDKVLSPQGIAQEVEWLSQQTGLFQRMALAEMKEETELAGENSPDYEDLTPLFQLLLKAVGTDFSHYKQATIRRRVIRRIALRKLTTLQDYIDLIRGDPAEARRLYNDLLINVTSFFRDTDTMEHLGKVVLPELVKARQAHEPFRLWVPACSTGEEVYSLAILLVEALDEQPDGPMQIQIFATDLSEWVIRQARLGHYTASQMEGVSPGRLKRFFSKEDTGYRISKTIRDLCVFAPHNVFADPPFSRLDLISCRNLLIYTDSFLQRKAIATFHYALNQRGYLVLGKAETVGSSAVLFRQVDKKYKIYARSNNNRTTLLDYGLPINLQLPVVNPVPLAQAGLSAGATPSKATRKGPNPNDTMNTTGSGDELDQQLDDLLRDYTPASVVVNKDVEILRFRGSTSLFLESAPGKASFSLLKMARPELVSDLRNVIRKAFKLGQPVFKTGLQIRVRDHTYHVAIRAIPFQTQEPLMLVLFEEVTLVPVVTTVSDQQINPRINELEEELAAWREDMLAMIEEQEAGREELQSANEEIISSNEELQSTNEELETSKEEIQSNNEELQTINQELQLSNEQLSEAYDYSDAIFGTIREGVLVLNKDLRVRSANRAFYKTFRVEPDDTVDRLIYELGNRQWDIPALRMLLERVIGQNEPILGFEMHHSFPEVGEKTLRLYARKIVRHQGQQAILLVIEDITDPMQVQRLLEYLQSILTHAPVSIQLFKAVRNERRVIVDFQLVPLVGQPGQRSQQSVEDVYKTSYKALYGDTEQGKLFEQYVQVVETGEPMQVETPYEQAKQGAWHLVSASRFEDGFLLVAFEATPQK